MIELNVIAALVASIITIVSSILKKRQKEEEKEQTSKRLDQLSDILKKASEEIREMEIKINDKRKKVEQLEKTAKELDELISLREGQVNAIKAEIKAIMEKSSKRNRIWTVLNSAIWFVLGIFVRGFLKI